MFLEAVDQEYTRHKVKEDIMIKDYINNNKDNNNGLQK